MTVKELIEILNTCNEDAEVRLGTTIGNDSSMELEELDIYERKADGAVFFDFSTYLYENELEENFYNNKSDLERLKEIKEFLESDWI